MIIGLDLGTTSISAVLFDPERDEVVASEERANDATIVGLAANRHEQCPAAIEAAARGLVESLVRQAGVSPERIAGLALTGQQHGLVVVNAGLKPLTNLITWRDARTADAPAGLCRHDDAPATGCFLHPGYGGLTLHHWVRTESLPKGASKVLPITGYLAAKLTGRCAVDETMAASWGILDVAKSRWHEPLVSALGLPAELLPDIVASGLPLGPMLDPCGLGLGPQTLVFSPAGDNQAGFAGVGGADGSEAVVNLGTSAQLSVHRTQYSFSRGLETRPFPGGTFLRVYAALCGGWAYAYLAEFFQKVIEEIGGLRLSLAEVFDRMQAYAPSTATDGLRADTRFAGERMGGVTAGSVAGIRTANLTPAHLTRAVATGIAAELAGAAAEMPLSGCRGLAVVGNAARRNPLLVKALEEQFGLPCRLVPSAPGGEAALGIARMVARMNEPTLVVPPKAPPLPFASTIPPAI